MRCINCNIDLHFSRRLLVLELDTRTISMIAEWIDPIIIMDTDYICQQCWEAAMRAVNASMTTANDDQATSSSSSNQQRQVGHSRVCLVCGRSVLRIPSELVLRTNPTERQQQIHQFVMNKIAPREVHSTDRLCHNCHRSAGYKVVQMQNQEPEQQQDETLPSPNETVMALPDTNPVTSQPSSAVPSQPSSPLTSSGSEWLPPNIPNVSIETVPTITLENYKRAVGSPGTCAFPQCHNNTHIIPDELRIRLLRDHKLYMPIHVRICNEHIINNEWELLFEAGSSAFSSHQIEHVFSFLDRNPKYDFEQILHINDSLLQYWVGLSRENFLNLINEVPSLDLPNMKTGLAALLIKYRTGDSDERISSLLNIPRRTLEGYMSKVRTILTDEFVPSHLGLSHLTRQEMLSHNLLIPNGLYGRNVKPIFIWDGTYTFTYKSANYTFQKDSYSLHKYRNLLKPMMIVLCDGYILDCLGPYKAVTSDAEIMLSLFNHDNNSIESYFREHDVFILDRGFRDALPLLERYGYEPHMPESLWLGNNQLTTQQANRSRCVTICRWPVEVVNGHMKRDNRLFRFEFNNKALPHLMQDFRIAAALYNRFAVRLTDRRDAQNILSVIYERIHLPNNLANVVANLNLNRRLADFISITVNQENILYFPRLSYDDLILFSLGTYQIRQAQSYYSEHVKINGACIIEVCPELPEYINLSELNIDEAMEVTLLRGKIRSRHVGRKVYYIYILIKNNSSGRRGILEYCCNCIVGRRTLGCCAHVMTVVWYLGWARYEDNIVLPASHLNHVFVEDE